MAKIAYNNIKNVNIDYTLFELNYGYHSWVFYKKDLDFYSKSKSVEKSSFKLQNLIVAC